MGLEFSLRRKIIESIHYKKVGIKSKCRCAFCKTKEDVVWTYSNTAYYWDGKGKNPNAPLSLCKSCAIEYNDYWNGMWKEYYSLVL